MAAYGFVAGLPLPLSGFTFRLWLSEGGVSLAVIGLTANIGLAYSLKFLWAPVLDNAAPPGPLRRLGRRRGWLLRSSPRWPPPPRCWRCRIPAHLPLRLPRRSRHWSRSCPPARTSWSMPGASRYFPQRRQGAAMAAYVWGYRVALLIATTGVISAVGIDRLARGAARRRGADRPRSGRHPAGAGTAAGGAPRPCRPASLPASRTR